jgi:hypothetical protein
MGSILDRLLQRPPTSEAVDPEELLDAMDEATQARADQLAREEQARQAAARQTLMDEREQLIASQRIDADEQAHIEATLTLNLSAALGDLEKLRAIELRCRPRMQRIWELNRELQIVARDPWSSTRVPGGLTSWVQQALQELRKR